MSPHFFEPVYGVESAAGTLGNYLQPGSRRLIHGDLAGRRIGDLCGIAGRQGERIDRYALSIGAV